MRKALIVLLLLISTRTLVSCCKENLFKFRWSKANLANLNLSRDTVTSSPLDSSKIENYGFRLRFGNETVAHHFIHDMGINTSYATTCDRSFQNMDSVTMIEVKTRNNFDASHPAGTSISEYLLARPGSSLPNPTNEGYKPVSENLNHVNANDIGSAVDFRFTGVTPLPGQHTFILTVAFKSGRVLSDSTSIRLY